MKQFYLAEIVTKDKLVHQGIYYSPSRKAPAFAKAMAGKTAGKAILWIHGLTSTFYNNVKLFELIADACEKEGIGFAAFNNRGHDIVTGIKKIDPREPNEYTRVNGGAGYERFEDCVYDIDAGISFLVKQGYSEIILVGHSTGANKVCYYAGTKRDKRVAGVLLLSPVSDRLEPSLDKEVIEKQLEEMKKKVIDGQGDVLMSSIHVFPVTSNRFISIFEPHSTEDVFDYGDASPKLACFSAIKQPLLVIIGSNDEYLDRPVKNVLDVFARHARSLRYKSVIIRDALHSYSGKEKAVVHTIFRWVREI
ncbi:MAG: alpha/beta fold hydrolase [Candidatus Gottesmanbacteria bacterium]|nr:alpha/beta fold hydrolase [Candidatus Gottesmanbacteria bacterium]